MSLGTGNDCLWRSALSAKNEKIVRRRIIRKEYINDSVMWLTNGSWEHPEGNNY